MNKEKNIQKPNREDYFEWHFIPMFKLYFECPTNNDITINLLIDDSCTSHFGTEMCKGVKETVLFHLLNILYWDSNVTITKDGTSIDVKEKKIDKYRVNLERFE